MARNRERYPKKLSRWQELEVRWSGPMANTVSTRLRFALWSITEHLAEIAGTKSARAKAEILRQLAWEKSQYDESGHRKFQR